MTTDSTPPLFVLHCAKLGEFKDVPLALSGYPKEEAGVACHYLKRELIPVGEVRQHPTDGYKIDVSAERADNWTRNFALMSERGLAIPAPPTHQDVASSFGKWVSLTREPNDRGGSSVFGVLKVVGDRNKEDVLNRDISIFVQRDIPDDKGNKYDEAITHVSVTPYPALTGLSGWTSIAASRGPAVAVPVFSLAAPVPPKESNMDLTKLREAIGAAKEITDDNVIALAVTKLGEGKTALELSNTSATTITALTNERDAAKLELSRVQQKPDAGVMRDTLRNKLERIDITLSLGKCTKGQADILRAAAKTGEEPNVLMLSRGAGDESPIDIALKVLELNKGMTGTASFHELPDAGKGGAGGNPLLETAEAMNPAKK